MTTVGIIANPASGKDIRRLVARSSVFDNNEKVNILRRVLIGLAAVGVERVVCMPDYYGLGRAALEDLHLDLPVEFLAAQIRGDERDSIEAARHFRELDAGCIITLGGDGTVRAVARTCGAVPIVAISTGTNNVVPSMVEGTIAGMAAGLVVARAVDINTVTTTLKRLEVYVNDELTDIALVDVVISTSLFVASRALWDPAQIREFFLAEAVPGSIGISSIGSAIQSITPQDEYGLHVQIGAGPTSVLAPVAPGLVTRVGVRHVYRLGADEAIAVTPCAGTIALDGERSLEIFPDQDVAVKLTRNGPRLVDIGACMQAATDAGLFVEPIEAEKKVWQPQLRCPKWECP